MTTHPDTDGNGYRWDEQLRQWVPAYGNISPAEMAADQAFRSHFGRVAIKASATARTDTITGADDPELTLAVEANTTYVIRAVLFYDAATGADFKFRPAVPSGSTLVWGVNALTSTATSEVGSIYSQVKVDTFSFCLSGGAAVGTKVMAVVEGVLTTGSTAGSVAINWAQITTGTGTATTLHIGSHLTARKV